MNNNTKDNDRTELHAYLTSYISDLQTIPDDRVTELLCLFRYYETLDANTVTPEMRDEVQNINELFKYLFTGWILHKLAHVPVCSSQSDERVRSSDEIKMSSDTQPSSDTQLTGAAVSDPHPPLMSISLKFQTNRADNPHLRGVLEMLGQTDESISFEHLADTECQGCKQLVTFVAFDNTDRMLCRGCYWNPFKSFDDPSHIRVSSLKVHDANGDVIAFYDDPMTIDEFCNFIEALASFTTTEESEHVSHC